MQDACLNCKTPLSGKYCSTCGQSAGTHRINFHFLWHDIQHGLLHVDKGILFTIRELFLRPGHSIREFLEGKRISHFKPISLLIVLASVYGFISHYLQINVLSSNIHISAEEANYGTAKATLDRVTDWVRQHYAFIALVQVPVFALGTYLGFRKAGYNFIEHVVLNAFLTSQRLALRLVTIPLVYFSSNTPALGVVTSIADFTGYLIMAWSLFQFFSNIHTGMRIVRILFSLICSFLIFLSLMLLIALYFFSNLNQSP